MLNFTLVNTNSNIQSRRRQFKLSIHIYNIDDGETTTISLNNSYEYIPRIGWTKSNDLLYILAMNRHQNKLDFILYNTTNSTSEILFSEKDKYYIDVHDNTTFTDDGQSLIWTEKNASTIYI